MKIWNMNLKDGNKDLEFFKIMYKNSASIKNCIIVVTTVIDPNQEQGRIKALLISRRELLATV